MNPLGPKARKLWALKMARDAVPPGGGMANAIAFLTSAALGPRAREAEAWVREALAAVRAAADPNPWREADDEAIAGELLRMIEEERKGGTT